MVVYFVECCHYNIEVSANILTAKYRIGFDNVNGFKLCK